MCWSPRVALIFVALELVSGTILFARGHRLLLLALGPLFLQEAIQYFLWLAVEEDEANGGQCGKRNIRLSIAELIVTGWLLPTCGAAAGMLSLKHVDDEVRRLFADHVAESAAHHRRGEPGADEDAQQRDGDAQDNSRAALLATDGEALQKSFDAYTRRVRHDRALLVLAPVVAGVAVILAATLWLWGAHSGWPHATWCTTRGQFGGHQRWPFVKPPLPPAIVHAFDATFGGGVADLLVCWWLQLLPERGSEIGLWSHGEPRCRAARAWLSDAAQLLCVYVPVGTLYMGLAAIGIAIFFYRGERLPEPRRRCCLSAPAPAACLPLPSAASTRGSSLAIPPLPPYRHGFLGCLSVVACGPGIIIPAWLLWGEEYGTLF